MHKRKDGKIIASLTEVKNKTGDIFALVDEFGEVTLTSYNKPKYRIIKVDIMETLKIDEEKEQSESESKEEKKSVMKKVADAIKPTKAEEPAKVEPEVTEVKEEAPEPVEKSEPVAETSSTESEVDLQVWDRNSKGEKTFTKDALKPLQ
ncbi:hypothetical protein KC678_04470 [Candidatus Dojkabacteria bacterium]|uniref:Uncharacterized protein n=1 Tax=Candidatus Dojkabacteria bacterium TaxID=2099670 RepID=A0A955RH47_9BACT|nr:hypothetical protein [Candidatus Dojkabacteria bacterium]